LRSQESKSSEKSAIYAVWGDFDLDWTQTPGTAPFIRGAVTIKVNPGVNSAAAKMDAKERPAGRAVGFFAGDGLAGKIKEPARFGSTQFVHRPHSPKSLLTHRRK